MTHPSGYSDYDDGWRAALNELDEAIRELLAKYPDASAAEVLALLEDL